MNEAQKVFSGQHRQPCFFRDRGIGRALLAVDDCHLAEEITLGQFCQNDLFLIIVANGNSHPTAFDQVHGIALVACAKQRGAAGHVANA